MTWTEGTISLFNDSIIICGGYWGIITFCLFVIVILAVVFLYAFAMWLLCDELYRDNT